MLIAHRLGISMRDYQNYERGENEISAGCIFALHSNFEINANWLLTGKGEMFRDPSKDIAQGVDFSVTIAGKKYVGKLHEMPD